MDKIKKLSIVIPGEDRVKTLIEGLIFHMECVRGAAQFYNAVNNLFVKETGSTSIGFETTCKKLSELAKLLEDDVLNAMLLVEQNDYNLGDKV